MCHIVTATQIISYQHNIDDTAIKLSDSNKLPELNKQLTLSIVYTKTKAQHQKEATLNLVAKNNEDLEALNKVIQALLLKVISFSNC